MFSFRNIGNSCYLNAGIQCLMRLPLLNQILDNAVQSNQSASAPFYKEYDDLRKMALNHENCVISPALFRHSMQLYAKHMGDENFMGMQQNDVSEFIQFVLNALHDALACEQNFDEIHCDNDIERKCVDMMKKTYGKEFSDVVHLFHTIQISVIKENITPETFLVLNLPLHGTTLVECVERYMESETIEGWYNEETKSTENVQRTLDFVRLPPILFLCLKRFSADGKKDSRPIDVPLELSIGDKKYDLQCGCLHQGGVNSGHYSAFASIKGAWTVIDDDTYYPMKETKNIYCVFYILKSSE